MRRCVLWGLAVLWLAGSSCSSADSDRSADAGDVCTGRYTVVEEGTDHCAEDASGLVEDTTTGLVWSRQDLVLTPSHTQPEADKYCHDKGMRLPTHQEAVAIAAPNREKCAFPCYWETWTSTPTNNLLLPYVYVTARGKVLWSPDLGSMPDVPDPDSVLCVRSGR
jgi:hypothetical protein